MLQWSQSQCCADETTAGTVDNLWWKSAMIHLQHMSASDTTHTRTSPTRASLSCHRQNWDFVRTVNAKLLTFLFRFKMIQRLHHQTQSSLMESTTTKQPHLRWVHFTVDSRCQQCVWQWVGAAQPKEYCQILFVGHHSPYLGKGAWSALYTQLKPFNEERKQKQTDGSGGKMTPRDDTVEKNNQSNKKRDKQRASAWRRFPLRLHRSSHPATHACQCPPACLPAAQSGPRNMHFPNPSSPLQTGGAPGGLGCLRLSAARVDGHDWLINHQSIYI